MARYIDADKLLKKQYNAAGIMVVDVLDIREAAAHCADVEEVRRGQWEEYDGHEDGYYHHRCSVCKEDAIYRTIYKMDYDEGMDGEWYELGERDIGIEEELTPRCPYCGAKMDGRKD